MVYMSNSAKKQIIKLMNKEGLDIKKNFVRIGIKNSGCTGFSYTLSFEKEKNKNDKIFEYKNIKILVNINHFNYLNGIIIDYKDGLNGKGFLFKNPNAKKTCGCGNSFSV
ncbi:HesB/IscA family protein [Candidatus Shikimatogenerans silvanidophilus]|uniref:HesB/IscA family protein n=1 Tax=Candidatus Shikimatogenerans silvanidophilus TaxID=2782547 RepID=UPI001BA8167F|nr:iron-sulfur cluster assembly accessory protein [Candidatus Shikimatogenerans silvanidophilus]